MQDVGEADPRLAAAVSGYDGSPAAHAEVLAALVDARVFAAITATSTAEHVEEGTGLRAESSAEMAVLLLERPDGSRGLPVFTDPAALRRWRLDARPVPMRGPEACQAALEQGATAVLLDGRVPVRELADLAQGWVPVVGSGLATRAGTTELTEPAAVPAALRAALADALRPEALRAARLLAGPDGPVLGVVPKEPLPPAELAALASRVVARLGSALPPEGLDLTVVPSRGPGLELRRSRWRR